jgi:hypothetical protein
MQSQFGIDKSFDSVSTLLGRILASPRSKRQIERIGDAHLSPIDHSRPFGVKLDTFRALIDHNALDTLRAFADASFPNTETLWACGYMGASAKLSLPMVA